MSYSKEMDLAYSAFPGLHYFLNLLEGKINCRKVQKRPRQMCIDEAKKAG